MENLKKVAEKLDSIENELALIQRKLNGILSILNKKDETFILKKEALLLSLSRSSKYKRD